MIWLWMSVGHFPLPSVSRSGLLYTYEYLFQV
jgi:hypothetical protein